MAESEEEKVAGGNVSTGTWELVGDAGLAHVLPTSRESPLCSTPETCHVTEEFLYKGRWSLWVFLIKD